LSILCLIQYSTEIPSQSNKRGKRNKRNINREERQIIPICRCIILDLHDPKSSTIKTLRHHKHFQQSSRMQNQYLKISN
jgi:hypothetical protein